MTYAAPIGLDPNVAAAHLPVISIRAAWYNELAGQEATYFPCFVGLKFFSAPPSGLNPKSYWRPIRKGVLTQGQKSLINLAVMLDGTHWLANEQPVSWSMSANSLLTLQTDAQFGKTSVFGDHFTVGTLLPVPLTTDPSVPQQPGNLGVSINITGTYADGTTIMDQLKLYPTPGDTLS